MNFAFFQAQVARLITRFGAKALDTEFIKLAWGEVKTMSEEPFRRFCDVLIGSRTHTRPPLLAEFREARIADEKAQFQREVQEASRFLHRKAPAEMKAHLRGVLSKDFGGCESLTDALEVAKLRNKLHQGGQHEG